MLAAAARPSDATPPADRIAAFAGAAMGAVPSRLEALAGDASTRRYHRVHFGPAARATSLVVMEMPPEARGAASENDVPFLNVRTLLARGGIPVPAVLAVDLPQGLIALEDLGDVTFEQHVLRASASGRRAAYEAAIELIVRLQELGRSPHEGCVAYTRRFDFALLRWELDHFREWLLEVDRGAQLSDSERCCVTESFDWLATTLADAPQVLVHRDFQSRNIMVRAGAPAPLALIDFQDALFGSAAYDLVALLRDSYVELAPIEVDELVATFTARARVEDGQSFRKLFHMQTAQRKLKDAGRFVFIDRVRGNPGFLRWIPTSLRYARDALAAVPELADLRSVLARHVPELG